MREKARNETAVKPLKTNNHAKCCFGDHNDFNDLRPALRNVSFRQAKDSFRFCGFWAAQGAKRNARAWVSPFDRAGGSCGRKKIRNSQPPRPEAPRSGLEGRFRSREGGGELDHPSRREAALRSLRREAG